MDPDILEFWGHLLINAANSQKLINEMNKLWGFSPVKYEGLLSFPPTNLKPDVHFKELSELINVWFKNFDAFFQTSLTMVEQFDFVPKSKYMALHEKYEAAAQELKKKDTQIIALQARLNENGADQTDMITKLSEMINTQGEQFQTLMEQVISSTTPKK